MKKLGIEALANHSYRALSGGQQQRVLLARALCAAEKVLLLDEPVSGLDPHAAKDMYAAIKHLNRDHGTTIIMITHDLSAVSEYGTRVLHMCEDPTYYSSPAEFFKDSGFASEEVPNE